MTTMTSSAIIKYKGFMPRGAEALVGHGPFCALSGPAR